MIPTYRRPDLARAAVLQWLAQSLPPALICVHQNGSAESYQWCVQDLQNLSTAKALDALEEVQAVPAIEWLHTPHALPQREWYLRPLRRLLERGCTHFFWADHDDLYLREHAARCVAELGQADFTVASHCGVLTLRDDDYRFEPVSHFTSHASGGMSSSMAFTRRFARQLADDLERDTATHYADNVLALATLPRFTRHLSARRTTVYVSHKGSLTSAGWVEAAFTAPDVPLNAVPNAVQNATQPGLEPSTLGPGPVLYGTRASGYRDVTAVVIARCEAAGNMGNMGRMGDRAGCWALPAGDVLRSAVLGDPAPNQVKHLVLCGVPDEEGRLVDRVLRESDDCTFRYAAGVLSASCPPRPPRRG
jgi:hypothetical protein